MKKIVISMMMVVLILGCGQRKEETKFQGVREKHDYIADGMNYLKQSDVKRAIQSFDQAIKQDPTNANNYVILGQVYLRLKNFSRAIDTFTAATRISPDNGELYYNMALSKSLRNAEESNDREQAIEDAKKSVELFQKSRDAESFKKAVTLLRSLMENEEEKTKESM